MEFQALKGKILVKIDSELHCEFQKGFIYSQFWMDIWPYIKTNLRLIWVEFWKSMEKKKFLMGIDPGSPLSLSRLPHSLIWCLNPLGHHWTGYKMIRKVRFCSAKIYFGLDIYKKSVYKKFTIPEVQEKESKFEEFFYKDKSWRLESACALPNIRIIQQLLLLFTNFIPISYSLKMERTFSKRSVSQYRQLHQFSKVHSK